MQILAIPQEIGNNGFEMQRFINSSNLRITHMIYSKYKDSLFDIFNQAIFYFFHGIISYNIYFIIFVEITLLWNYGYAKY